MKINNIIKKRAISSNNLKNRLNLNKKLGSVDLTPWLFKRYKIKKNDYILEIGCGMGQHVTMEQKIVGTKGMVVATDISQKSLNKIKKAKNVIIKKVSMENLPKYLSKLKMKFDKIISSYAFYYAKNPITLLKTCKNFLKPSGMFLITAPCYPHTLTEFAKKTKTLPHQAEKYIDFGKKKLEPFIKKKSKKKIYQFKNRLSFKNKNDLLDFYRSTIFYNKSKEVNLIKMFVKKNRLEVIKSAKLYEFY